MITQKYIISVEVFNLLQSIIQEEPLPVSVTPGNQYRDTSGNIYQSMLVETPIPEFFQKLLFNLEISVLNPIKN